MPSAPPGPRAGSAPERVLVKEVNWLGDLVISLPALRAVRAAYPAAHLAVLVKHELAGFFDGMAGVDEVLAHRVRRGPRGVADLRHLVRSLREKKFDLAVLFPNSFESALWMWLARIPRRAGYIRDGRRLLLTHRVKPDAAILETHQVHYYLHMLQATLGITGRPEDCRLQAHEPHRERMRRWLAERRQRPGGPLIALAVAAAYGPAKEWPRGHFAELVDRLAERHGAECVLVGAPGERAKCEETAALARHKPLIAAGETGVGEALALLSLCDGFAGNDSGSMHLAGALGLPTVGIFGSTRADRTSPLGPRTTILYRQLACNPCLKRACRFGHYDCLRTITPEEVEAALMKK